MMTLSQDAGVVTLVWDTPGKKQNVFNGAALDALEAAITEAFATPGATGLIITSGKRDFVAGADLEMLQGMTAQAHDPAALQAGVGRLSKILRRLETGGIPVVAALNGTALGGGLELALACHRRIAADNPRLVLGLPEATLGLLPGAGGTQRLPRLIGVKPSLGPLLEGTRLSAQEARALGVVDEVVPPDQLLEAARAWLATKPPATQPWDRKGFAPPGGGPEVPDVANLFMVAAAAFQARTFGNYPAGKAILSCLYEGLRLDMEAALAVEVRYFVELVRDPVAGNMIRTMFVSLGEANKLARRPADVPKLELRRLGVLGAGLMGSGIAYEAARKGIEVTVLDVTPEKAEAARTYAARLQDKAVARGKTTAEQRDALLARIHPTTAYADLAGCDAVIEAVFEDRAIKAEVTRQADAVLGDGALFGSNTSTLPITGLAEASSRPERFVGLHFFSPVERMQLVEVIRARQTSDAALAHALDLVTALGKTPIVVSDSRGFYTSRVFGTYITEGIAMLTEGVLPALIENAGRRSGMPMPPLALADDVGLGLMHAVGVATRRDLGDAAPTNPSTPVLDKLVVELGRTGRRGGGGFYRYEGDKKALWTGLREAFPPAAAQPPVEELVDRMLVVQALEAARCMEAGVLLAVPDADVGAVLGWGFAPWTGGPLSYIDTIGAAAFVAKADALAARFGERFSPPAILREMGARGGRWYGG
jgi:3-hydroxyacyl-CoA dehydrogenase/enoyl-CoA hydratase/3-hydroxybutyryl-CoA epimerase